MAAQKVYSIQINGLTESVKAVDALNESLKNIESRIKALDGKSVKVGASSSGGGTKSSSTSSLSEEEKLEKQIAQLEEKRIAYSKEVYQNYLAAKDVLKETVKDQQQLAAAERVQANTYSNTMEGIKQKLADLKSVHFTTDISTDEFKKQTEEINELTNKLKKLEEEYGVYTRNVGNYASAADGFKGLRYEIAGTVQEFDNAKQALKELKKERDTLAVKSELGIISEEEAKRLKDLIPTVAHLQSAIQDAGKPMDAIMDTMQSIVAIAQTAKGFSAFFGLDSDEIERSIQKLVALQNAMQGLQTIQKQLQSGEGIGGWIKKASSAMDAFAASITKTDKAAKGFALSLKVLSGIALVAVIYQIIKALSDLKKESDEVKKATEDGLKAYAKAESELTVLQKRLNDFNGTKKQEKKLVDELNSKYGTSLGQYKSLSQWKTVLAQKGRAYCQVLQKEAEMQALMNIYTENFIKLQKAKQAQEEGNQDTVDLILKALDGQATVRQVLASIRDDIKAPLSDDLNEYNNELDREIHELEEKNKKILEDVGKLQTDIDELNKNNKLNDNSDQIDKNTDKTKKSLEEGQKSINQLEVRLMQEGLNKKLRQLDEEERQTINKLKENGRKTSDEIAKIQRAYTQIRIKTIQEYLQSLEEKIKESAKNISEIDFNINVNHIKNTIDSLRNDAEKMKTLDMGESSFQPLTSSRDLEYKVDDQLSNSFKNRYRITSNFYKDLIELLVSYQKDEQALTAENIKEEEKKQREAENDRFSIQMSGLTKTKAALEEASKAIVKKYGVIAEDGAIEIKAGNKEIEDSYKKLQADIITVDDQIETAKKQHKQNLNEITTSANNAIKKNELDTAKEISTTQEKNYNLQVSNYREFLSKLNDEVNQNPVVSKGWGIVNVTQTKKNYNEIINAAKAAVASIEAEEAKVSDDPLLTDEAKNATLRQLDDIKKSILQGMNVTKEASKNLVADLMQSIQMYLQETLNSFNTIMQAVWQMEDNEYDDEQERLDKENEMIQDKLSKQADIISQYKSTIDSIEDELATSRGDRRQHLIDQLNAEMEAERRAQKEKERLQKEEERNKKKQEELEKKRKKSQYNRDKLQAIVNGAMAVTMAAINTWPIPAIPMMALAASTTAAQLAIMAANKPYRVGGQLEGGLVTGKRHTQGGVPVGNTGIEVEGSEYIIRRESTTPNLNLLEFINKSQKKLDLSDFIDFYAEKPRKVIKGIQKRTFADGGVLPTLPNALDIRDQLQNVIINQDNRPIYVSVVDINNKQEDVRRVQALAGL